MEHKYSRRSFLKTLGVATGTLFLTHYHLLAKTAPRDPNIIFIMVDDMGYGDLGCYGNTFHETPNIDRLAQDGMKFTNAYAAAPNCSPTRASVLTGQWPARVGITQYLPGNKESARMQRKRLIQPDLPPGLALNKTTIAEALKRKQYAAASIGKWHLGGDQYLPEHQGFDFTFAGGAIGHHVTMFSPYKTPVIPDAGPGKYLTDYLTDKAEQFIEHNRNNPFFLYLPLYAVHSPIEAKKDLIEKYQQKLSRGFKGDPTYAAMVEGVDASVKRIRQKLEELDITKNTIIFFFSDNGGVPKWASNGPLRTGKGYLYEGGIREPLIVVWPGEVQPGSICDTPVSSVDFFPTITEMAGIPNQQAFQVDGLSLVLLLHGKKQLNRDTLYWHYPHYSNAGCPPCSAIREGDFKLIQFYEDDHLELYDLKHDIGESHNLLSEYPSLGKQLHQKLVSWREELHAKMPWPNPNYREDVNQ